MINLAKTDPVGCGCDDPELAGKLIPVNIALETGLALAEPVAETETVPLARAMGRITAEAAVSPVPLPPFNNSAMDGYALRTDDLIGGGSWTLPVSGRIAAGDPGYTGAPKGSAVRIFTGAPVPSDMDAVVMQEYVERVGSEITLKNRPEPGQNIRLLGEDMPKGGAILPAGTEITSREACALAASGHGHVTLRRKLRVAIFCTGSELKAPGEDLGPGQIWNSNRYMLLAALNKPWIELVDLGTVEDSPESLTNTLIKAAKNADMVISTGGVSVGDEDHMPAVFRAAGGNIHAMRVAMKPGKPVAIGTMGDAIYVGLPGNPVSAFVTWHVIGAPILAKRAGAATIAPRKTTVKAGFTTNRRPGRCEFRPARLVGYDANGTEIAEVLSPSYSARVALLCAADGLALIPADAEKVTEGDVLEFLKF